ARPIELDDESQQVQVERPKRQVQDLAGLRGLRRRGALVRAEYGGGPEGAHRMVLEARVERSHDPLCVSRARPATEPQRAPRQGAEQPSEDPAAVTPPDGEDPQVHLAQVDVQAKKAQLQVVERQRQDVAALWLSGDSEA